jgi:hypothetical protein
VNSKRREVALSKNLVELDSSFNFGYKDNNLIEKKVVKEIRKLLVFLIFTDVDIILEDTFQNKLSFIINEDFF